MAGKQVTITRRGEGRMLDILGTRTRFLCPGVSTGGGWSLMEVELPRDAGAPPHSHPWDEAYYVLSGEIGFMVDGEQYVVHAGDFLYAPADTVHAFHGRSAEPARVIIFDAPAHAETFFTEVDTHVKAMPRDLPKMLEIGARHQVRFAAPAG